MKSKLLNIVRVLISAVLIVLAVVGLSRFKQEKEMNALLMAKLDSLSAEKDSLSQELGRVKDSYNLLNLQIGNLQNDLKGRDDRILEMEQLLSVLQGDGQSGAAGASGTAGTSGTTNNSGTSAGTSAAQNPYNYKLSAMKESVGDSYRAVVGDTALYGRADFEKYSFYELNTWQNVGVVRQDNIRSRAPKFITYEAGYGVRATVDGFVINFSPYNHYSKEHPMAKNEIVSDQGDTVAINLAYGETTKVDCSGLAQGMYYLRTEFDETETMLYFYVAENGVFTVKADDYRNVNAHLSRNELVAQKLAEAGVTPENSLYIGDIIYPCQEYGREGDTNYHRCDTGRWAQLAHDLLDDFPNWTDEMKVYMLSDWMVRNIAYDDWKVKNGHSRAYSLGVWDGTYAMWDTKVGVCADFSNVMVIMLREMGIPATSFESDTHMWNVVYLDGVWRELDITDMLAYHVSDFEMQDRTNRGTSFSRYLGYMSTKIVTVGDDIWTIERAKRP